MNAKKTTRTDHIGAGMCMRHVLHMLFAACIAASLAACGRSVDANQARACRAVLPALHAEDARIIVQAVTVSAMPRSLRVDYRVRNTSGPERGHFVICTFAEEGLGLRKTEITALHTEHRALTGASLYFLKRFWLEEKEAESALPEAPARPAVFGSASPAATTAIQHAASALPMIAITALLACAYALIYGLAGRILLVFGEFALLGAAATAFSVAAAEWNGFSAPVILLAAGLLVCVWCAAWMSATAARTAFLPVLHRSGHHVMIVSVGLALALAEFVRLTQGSGRRWLSPVWNESVPLVQGPEFSATMTVSAMGVTAAAAGLALGLIIFMQRSAFGRAWRAASDDAVAASLMGVHLFRLTMMAFIMAACLAAVCGFLLTVHVGGMGYSGAAVFGLKALVGAILGGIGSIGGALLGGLLLGIMEGAWSAFMPIEWRDVFVFALLSILLIIRPGGLMGHGELLPRQV